MRAIALLGREGRAIIDRHPDHGFITLIFAAVASLAFLGGILELAQSHWNNGLIAIGAAGLLFAAYGAWTLHIFEQDQDKERQRLVKAADEHTKGAHKK